jgi:hypothetical protein
MRSRLLFTDVLQFKWTKNRHLGQVLRNGVRVATFFRVLGYMVAEHRV